MGENNSGVFIYADDGKGGEKPSTMWNVHPIKVHVERIARVISAPVEDGRSSFDNKVIEPVRITVTCKVDLSSKNESESVIAQINAWLRNRTYQFCSIRTRTGFFKNLILEKAPSVEEIKEIDLGTYDLVFVEAILIQGAAPQSLNPDNYDTTKGGYISGGGMVA